MSECIYVVGQEYEIAPATPRDLERMMTIGYVCDCGCGTYWGPSNRTVQGPPMLGCRESP